MIDPAPTYANAQTKTPSRWRDLEVIDRATGQVVYDVMECDAVHGWAYVYVRDEHGHFRLNSTRNGAQLLRITGAFELRWRA